MKKWIAGLLVLCLCLCGCQQEPEATPAASQGAKETTPENHSDTLTVLYTNDTHGYAAKDPERGTLGYAALAAYREELADRGNTVLLADGGGCLYGGELGLVSQGQDVVSLMNETGYAVAAPGRGDFLYGIQGLKALPARFDWVCCNLVEEETGLPVFAPYKMVAVGEHTVAFVGVASPVILRGLPQGCEGYSFCQENLYDQIQKTIDAALAEGAEAVICIGSAGIEPEESPFTATEIIANTTGMAVYLGGGDYPAEGVSLEDSKGDPVLLLGNNENFGSFAEVNIDLTKHTAQGKLVRAVDGEKPAIAAYTESLLEGCGETASQKLTGNSCNLDNAGTGETVLGSFCCDAIREAMGADAALLPGNVLLAGLPKGDISAADCMTVFSDLQKVCAVEATGREILDALEYANREREDPDGWLQVSGIAYRVNFAVPSGVVTDENGAFVEIQGPYRVTDVTVGGKPLEPEQVYILAGPELTVGLGGGGYAMFADCPMAVSPVMTAQDALIRFVAAQKEISVLEYGFAYKQRAEILGA